MLKGRGYCPVLLFRYDDLYSATALFFGSASAALGRFRFGAASTAFCRCRLRGCRLQCSGGCRRRRSRRFRRFRGDKAGAGQETGYAEPCQVLFEILLIHGLFTSFPGQCSCCLSSKQIFQGNGRTTVDHTISAPLRCQGDASDAGIAEEASCLSGKVSGRRIRKREPGQGSFPDRAALCGSLLRPMSGPERIDMRRCSHVPRDSATALLFGAASAALGRGLRSVTFGAASAALCRSLLCVAFLAASAGMCAAPSH